MATPAGAASMPDAPLLECRGLAKRFGGVAALVDASFEVRAGSVHALVGENGAGKSTLINVLGGALAPDGGELRWRGAPLRLAAPRQAARLGIAVVHQEPQLMAGLSALDNLFIGDVFPTVAGTPLLARGEMRRRARAAGDAVGIALPWQRPVAELSPTERTLLALLRCLMRAPALLILDEPTAAFTDRDAARLLRIVADLRRRGTAVVYVSHRLGEVLQLADRVTVLRNGSRVAGYEAAGLTAETLIEAMSGRRAVASAPQPRPAPPGPEAPPLLELRHASGSGGRVGDVSLRVAGGELVGVYGLAGSGRTALLELLAGLRPMSSGALLAWARDGRRRSSARDAAEAMQRGRVLIPEDRRGHALVPTMRVRENLTLPFVARYAMRGLIARRRERRDVAAWLQRLDIRARGPEQSVVELSGGNQQKLVFARALALRPDLLLCDEPTQAVDVGTRAALHALLRQHAAGGGAALVVISDLDEMLALVDRVVVLREGRSVATLVNHGLAAETVLRHCFGAAGQPVTDTTATATATAT